MKTICAFLIKKNIYNYELKDYNLFWRRDRGMEEL